MTTGRARPATLLGLGMLAVALVAVITLGAPGAVVYYVTPTELAADPTDRAIRLYGVVEPGSVRWEAGTRELRFVLSDGTTAVSVRTQAIPTALFRDGVAVVGVSVLKTADYRVSTSLDFFPRRVATAIGANRPDPGTSSARTLGRASTDR